MFTDSKLFEPQARHNSRDGEELSRANSTATRHEMQSTIQRNPGTRGYLITSMWGTCSSNVAGKVPGSTFGFLESGELDDGQFCWRQGRKMAGEEQRNLRH